MVWGDQARPGGQAFWGKVRAGKGGMDIRCLDGLREVLSGIWDEPEGQAGKWASWLQDAGGTGAPGCGQSLGMWVGCYVRAPSMPLTRVRSGGQIWLCRGGSPDAILE